MRGRISKPAATKTKSTATKTKSTATKTKSGATKSKSGYLGKPRPFKLIRPTVAELAPLRQPVVKKSRSPSVLAGEKWTARTPG
jgi:hypothetical protein